MLACTQGPDATYSATVGALDGPATHSFTELERLLATVHLCHCALSSDLTREVDGMQQDVDDFVLLVACQPYP